METKTVLMPVAERNRLITRFNSNDYDIADVILRAYQSGYTAAQSEQSEMVKKSEVVELLQDKVTWFRECEENYDSPTAGRIAVELEALLTKLKDL